MLFPAFFATVTVIVNRGGFHRLKPYKTRKLFKKTCTGRLDVARTTKMDVQLVKWWNSAGLRWKMQWEACRMVAQWENAVGGWRELKF